MSELYSIKVDEKWSFESGPKQVAGLDLIKTAEGTFHILQQNRSFTAKVVRKDFYKKQYTIEVNGTPYQVAISDSLDQQISQMGFELGSSKNISEIEAPMPGLILEIITSEGAEVAEGDPLLILEAMKMENVIASPRDGVIKKIHIAKGNAVDKKSLLLVFE